MSVRLVQSIQLDFIPSLKQVSLKYLSYWIFKESEEIWTVWKSYSAVREDNIFLV